MSDAQQPVRSTDLLAALRDSAMERADVVSKMTQRLNPPPDGPKELMLRARILVDFAEVITGAMQNLKANAQALPPGEQTQKDNHE